MFTWLLPANTSNQLTRRKSVQIYGRFSFFFVCCYAGGQEVVVDFFFLPFSSFLFVFMRLTTPFGSTSSFDSFHFLSFFFLFLSHRLRPSCDRGNRLWLPWRRPTRSPAGAGQRPPVAMATECRCHGDPPTPALSFLTAEIFIRF